MKTALMAFLSISMLVGCGDGPPPAVPDPTVPDEPAVTDEAAAKTALGEMLKLAEAGDWGAYVDGYYGEKEKYTATADRDALVKRFKDNWGAKVLPILKLAVELEPRIDGDKAVFENEEGLRRFVLHRTAEGGWSFHL